MANPVNPVVGVPTSNPNPAPSTAESEGTVTPSAAQPSGGSSSKESVFDACQAYDAVVDPANETLMNALPAEVPTKGKALARLSSPRQKAMPLLIQMLRDFPTLSGAYTADDIQSDSSDASACMLVATSAKNMAATADHAANVTLDGAWIKVSEVYETAKKRAKGNANLTRAVAAVEAILAIGPREDTAPRVAATAQVVATRLTTRAGKATSKATSKATKVAALQHGTGDATITQPAPAAPAPAGSTPVGSTPAATIR